MPTYEYQCDVCGRRFERFQNMTEKPLKKCPDCGGKVRRLISGGRGVLIKGADTSCALRSTGRTCCGRDQRCDKPACEA